MTRHAGPTGRRAAHRTGAGGPAAYGAGANRPGFGLVELMIVVMIIGILARISLPAYHNLILHARATQLVGEIHAIRVAVYSYNVETNRWPEDTQAGVVPPELEPYLGDGYSFVRDGYTLDWDNWILPDGTPKHPDTGTLLGISVSTSNTALGQALLELVGDAVARYTLNDHYTFILAAF